MGPFKSHRVLGQPFFKGRAALRQPGFATIRAGATATGRFFPLPRTVESPSIGLTLPGSEIAVTFAALLLTLTLQIPPTAANPDAKAGTFDFADGDRVVLIGGTLIEREQASGYWELALTLRNKDKAVTFRNLGWSGDTVWGESRGSFDGPAKGYAKLIELTKELKPTVILLCYGQNESFAGEKGVKAFAAQYEKLLKDLAPTKARFVLLSPTPFQEVAPLRDAKGKNANLAKYVAAIKELAAGRKADFVDVYQNLSGKPAIPTENGVHYSEAGYAGTRMIFQPNETIDTSGSEDLRKAIVAKNELFFHRWRPQNETYLFGFRKHEQGKNGKEIAEFDPLVAKEEEKIAGLRKGLK